MARIPSACSKTSPNESTGNRTKQPGVQQSRPMNDAQNNDSLGGDPINGAIGPEDQMPVGGAKDFVFRDARTALGKLLQRGDLLFKGQDKSCGVAGAVLGDVLPDIDDVGLGGRRDLNAEGCGHA